MSGDQAILFVKAPVPGRVKTRLVPAVSPQEAARLYRGWVRDAYARLERMDSISVEVAYDPHPDWPEPDWIGPAGALHFPQEGKSLGERLEKAFVRAFSRGARNAAALGSDSPGLPEDFIAEAFRELRTHDLVLGPTSDGGYYLIGLAGKPRPGLFRKISWSTGRVFSQTLSAARGLGLKIHVLGEYFDVDRPEDLLRIPASARGGNGTISVILPVYNEAETLGRTVRSLRESAGPHDVEVVAVDGGSRDGTLEAARSCADLALASPKRGRAAQMHLGAERSHGEILLFLHADTRLPEAWPTLIRNGLAQASAAAFSLDFDVGGYPYNLIRALAGLRNRLTGVPHGDQGLAVRRIDYFSAGGFPDVPLMEEYALLPKLKRMGPMEVLKERAVTSARRYVRRGPLRNALRNSLLLLGYHAGVPVRKIASWYHS